MGKTMSKLIQAIDEMPPVQRQIVRIILSMVIFGICVWLGYSVPHSISP